MRLPTFILSQNLSIDNALSTIQVIHQLITQVNKVVDYVNQIDITANDYTDKQINKLKTEIKQLEEDLKAYTDVALDTSKSYTDDALDTAKTYTDSAFNNATVKIDELKDKVNDDVAKLYSTISDLDETLRSFITYEDSKLKVAIDEAYNSLVKLINEGNTLVTSPVDGRSKSIQQALNDIFNLIKIDVGCITLKFAKKMFSNDLSVQGPDNNNLYFGNITLGDFKNSTYYNVTSIYLNFSSYVNGNSPQPNYFILHNRLDCIRLYSFELLYVVALSYIINNGIDTNNATTYLNATLHASLGVGYGSPINTHAWNHI